jgi:alpha-1,2-mannosyltransferase
VTAWARRLLADERVWLVAALVLAVRLVVAVPGRFGDLAVYRWAAGVVWRDGALYVETYTGTGADHPLPFTYPPFAAMLFRPLSWVPFDVLARLWIALSLLLLARVCLLLVRATGSTPSAERRDGLVVLCAGMLAEPLSSTLGYGQVNVLLLWLVVEDLLGHGVRAGAHRRTSGLLTGIAAGIKVTPLLLVAYLAVIGRVRDAGRAVLAFLVTVAVATVVVPHTTWTFWTHALWRPDRAGAAALANNQSIAAVLTRLVHHELPGRLWLVPAALVAVVSLVVARRLHLRGDDLLGLGAVVLGMLLASPISWTHHWVWALVPAVAMWRATRGGRALAATFLVLSVTALIYLPQRLGAPDLEWSAWEQVVGNGYALWALTALAWCAHRSRRRATVDAMLVPCPAT